MRTNFSSGDRVQEKLLGLDEGLYENIEMPIDAEVLEVGWSKEGVKLFFGTRQHIERLHKKRFLVHRVGEKLPRNDFQYFWYLGTLARKGLCIFEVI